jgi:hypothetical protein
MNPKTQKHELPRYLLQVLQDKREKNLYFLEIKVFNGDFVFPEDMPEDRLTGLCLRLVDATKNNFWSLGSSVGIYRFMHLTNLTTLILIDMDLMVKKFSFDSVDSLNILPNLTELTLTDVSAQGVWTLLQNLACPEKLRSLRIVHRPLGQCSQSHIEFQVESCNAYVTLLGSGIFQNLEFLEIHRSLLSDWSSLATAFPRLRTLVLRDVPVRDLGFLRPLSATLEHVELVRTNLGPGWDTLKALGEAKKLKRLSITPFFIPQQPDTS